MKEIGLENYKNHYLKKYCDSNQDCFYISQANKKNIKDIFNVEIKVDKSNRIFDFVLYNNKKNKIFIIEVNFYSSQGSKLKATAGE
ncbi:MAG: DpnII family type II restriction endonuclease, partial [Nanoarchaeota archaeon]